MDTKNIHNDADQSADTRNKIDVVDEEFIITSSSVF